MALRVPLYPRAGASIFDEDAVPIPAGGGIYDVTRKHYSDLCMRGDLLRTDPLNGEGGTLVPSSPYAAVPAVLPQRFGAVGDGVADDTAALQAAIDATAAAGTKLYLPAGTYKVTSTLTVPSSLEIVGAGIGLTKIDGGANTALTILSVLCPTQTHFVLSDLEILGGGVQVHVSGAGLLLRTSCFLNVTFYQYARKGLHIAAIAIGTSNFNLQFAAGTPAAGQATYGLFCDLEVALHYTTWYNVRCTLNTGAGVWIGGAPSTLGSGNQGAVFHQLTLEGNAGHGIYLYSACAYLYNPFFEVNGSAVSASFVSGGVGTGGAGAAGFDVALDSNYAGASVVRARAEIRSPTFDTPHANQLDVTTGTGKYRRIKYMNQGVDLVLTDGLIGGTSFVDVNGKHISTTWMSNSPLSVANIEAAVVQVIVSGHARHGRMICVGSSATDSGISAYAGGYGGVVWAICSGAVGSPPSATTRSAVYRLNLVYDASNGTFAAGYVNGTSDFVTFAVNGSGNVTFKATDNTNVAVSFVSNI